MVGWTVRNTMITIYSLYISHLSGLFIKCPASLHKHKQGQGINKSLKVKASDGCEVHCPSGYRNAVTRRLQCTGLHHRQRAIITGRRPAWRFHHRGFHWRIDCGRPAWRIHNRGLHCRVICGRPAWWMHNRGLSIRCIS